MNYYPITVIDNFYEDPYKIRDFALKQEFKFCHELKDYGHVFPGSRTQDLSLLNAPLFQKVCEKFTSVFHNFDYDQMRWSITSSFQSVTKEYDSGVIHQDTDTVFAGVLFLSPEPGDDSGTSLFKENKSFDQKIYDEALQANDVRFNNNEKVSFDYHNMFDEILRVRNVFNTLIMYEGHHHHAANKFFGDCLENSRLTQVFFVKRVDATKESNFPLLRTKKIII